MSRFWNNHPEELSDITYKAAAKFLFMNYQHVYGEGPPMDDPLFHDSAPFKTMTAMMDSLQSTQPDAFWAIMKAGGNKYVDEFRADYAGGLIDAAMEKDHER